MKKIILGFILGVGLTLSFNVYAAVESIIGKTVEGTAAIKLNGSKLDKESIIVDGSSYAPVRAIGEALKLNVDYQNNEVVLNNKGASQQVIKPIDEEQAKRNLKLYDLRKQSDEITKQIEELYQIILPYEMPAYNGNTGYEKKRDAVYTETVKKREELISQRDGIDKQMKELYDEEKKINDENMEKLRERLGK